MVSEQMKADCVRWGFRALHAIGVKTVRHQLKCGSSMILHTNDAVAQRVRYENAFEPEIRKEFLRLASQHGNIIDVGANIGYYSVLGATVIGPQKHVFAFEPQVGVANKLRQNLELNGLSNVTVFPMALSDSEGTVQFCVPLDGEEAFGSMHNNGRFPVKATVDVPTKRLDDVIAEESFPEVSLVKMDAEGAELLILRGATNLMKSAKKPTIIFEANETNMKPFGYGVFDLLQFVQAHGYRLRQIDSEDWIAEPEPA